MRNKNPAAIMVPGNTFEGGSAKIMRFLHASRYALRSKADGIMMRSGGIASWSHLFVWAWSFRKTAAHFSGSCPYLTAS